MNRKSIPTTYSEALDALKGRGSRTIAHNTRLGIIGNGEAIGLWLHATCIVTFNRDGSIALRTGGWQTVTTKDRLNRVARAHGWSVFAKACVWYIAHRSGTEFEFEEGFAISPPAREPSADARVENHGTIFLVRPLTEPALDWLTEHTDGTWFGNALAVEHRFVSDLVSGLRDCGFVVEAAR